MRVISRKCPRQILLVLSVVILLSLWPGVGLAETETVDTIVVTVAAAEPPPARIAKRMTASIMTVGEQILVGRTLNDVETNQANYEDLVRDIFNRVLIGYTVEQVKLTPGTSTNILVAVRPWGDVVRDISLEIDIGGLSPKVMTLIKNDMGNKIEDQVADVLIGLPVDSVEWAGGISKTVIREWLATELPEFRSNLEITAGQHTSIKLSLIPTGPTINNVELSLRSSTIPNILLAEARPPVREAADMLRGLPVAFVERHKEYFSTEIQRTAAKHPIVKKYGLVLTPVVNPGVDTEITLQAETTKYRVSLEGSLDMGREKDNTLAKLHFGKFTGKRDEAFMEIKFLPDSMEWEFEPGWGHKFTENTLAGLKYNISEHESILWLNHNLGPNWAIRLEDTPKTDYYEFGVRYKLHEFLSAEYVITEKENWLRMIANL